MACRILTAALVIAAGLVVPGPRADAQEMPAGAPEPRVLLLSVEADRTVDDSAIDVVDEALDTLPALASWARPASSCDPELLDTLAGRPRCLASAECVREVAHRCRADLLVQASVRRGSGDRVEVTLRVIDGAEGVAAVEERLAAPLGVALERVVREGMERVARSGWLAGRLEVRGPSTGIGVRVDGHDVGVAPVFLERLAAGHHRIELLADGHVAYRGEVEVEPGNTSVVRASARAHEERLVVSVARRGTGHEEDANVHQTGPRLAWSSEPSEASGAALTSLDFVVFEDRDARRDVLRGRGRLTPTYSRGGVGATLRLDFQ